MDKSQYEREILTIEAAAHIAKHHTNCHSTFTDFKSSHSIEQSFIDDRTTCEWTEKTPQIKEVLIYSIPTQSLQTKIHEYSDGELPSQPLVRYTATYFAHRQGDCDEDSNCEAIGVSHSYEIQHKTISTKGQSNLLSQTHEQEIDNFLEEYIFHNAGIPELVSMKFDAVAICANIELQTTTITVFGLDMFTNRSAEITWHQLH